MTSIMDHLPPTKLLPTSFPAVKAAKHVMAKACLAGGQAEAVAEAQAARRQQLQTAGEGALESS